MYWRNLVARPGVSSRVGTSRFLTLSFLFLILVLPSTPAADVITYVLGKNHHFDQFGPAPFENASGETWEAGVNVYGASASSIISATLSLPAAGVTLPLTGSGNRFQLSEYFDLKSDLDQTAPPANYVLTISTLNDGVKTCSLNLSADAYPNAPQILSTNEAQQIAAQSPFTLRWSPFSGATVNDFILVVAAPEYGETPTNFFMTPLPNQTGVLLGTNTQVIVPANTLPTGYSGYFKVGFFKMVDRNTSGYPGVTGYAGYGSITKMPFQTIARPMITQPLPASLTTNVGATVTFNAGATGGGLTYQWRRDGVAMLGAVADTLMLANLQTTNSAAYSVVISNGAGSVTNGPVSLVVVGGSAGAIDANFVTGASANGAVRALALRPDGRILAGGSFTLFNQASHPRLVSVSPNGAIDTTFAPANGADNDVNALALQSDGKLLVGGSFNFISGVQRPGLARLDATGTVDSSFTTGTSLGPVFAIALRGDGKIAMGGSFLSVGGSPKSHIALLQSNGAADTTFTASCNGDVRALAFLPDNRIVVGGAFTTVNNTTRPVVARLLATGQIDPTFHAPTNITGLAYAVAIQPDGKILVAGTLDHVDQLNVGRILRLNPDGSLDTTFRTGVGASFNVRALVLQPDNKILIGGEFTGYDNLSAPRVARLNPDGSLDQTFGVGSGANNTVMSICQQPDGKVLAGGFFTTFSGTANPYLARIYTETAASAPVFTYQPVDRTVFSGENAAFYASVACSASISYQWQTNGVDVTGATNSSITITGAQFADQATYRVRATAGGVSITSSNANLVVLPQPQLLEHLAHRYSFSEFAGATQVVDSIGNAHGTLVSPGAGEGFNGAGQLSLSALGGYVSLPSGLISPLRDVTLEMWVTWNGPNTVQYETYFYFGGGSAAFHLMPLSDFPTARLFFSTNITVIARPTLRTAPPPSGVPVHFAVVYQFAANTSKLYMNGQLVAIGSAPSPLSAFNDANAWLGHSPNAPFLNGVLDEFRIYDAALSDASILTSYQAGPDAQQLSVHFTAGNLQLSWPLNGSPITLVGTSDLSAGFQPVTYTAVTNGAVVTVNLPTSSSQMFYRLRSP